MASNQTAFEGVFSARWLGVCLCASVFDVVYTWWCGPLGLLSEPLFQLRVIYRWPVP